MEIQSYLEIKTPISTNARWMDELHGLLHNIPVRWQNGYYHITIAFLDKMDEEKRAEAKRLIDGVLAGTKAQRLTIDKVSAFTTKDSSTHIVHAASSCPDENLMELINEIRQRLTNGSFQIEPDFKLHITLGKVSGDKITLAELHQKLATLTMPAFTLNLTKLEYRCLRASSIKKWHLEH